MLSVCLPLEKGKSKEEKPARYYDSDKQCGQVIQRAVKTSA